MTMVLDPQGRQYGGMGYESNMYTSMHAPPPNFSDPWQHQTSNHAQYGAMKTETRPPMQMSYNHLPPTSTAVSQEASRSTGSYTGSQYSAPSTTSATYAPSYPSLNYAQQMQQQQAQQQRKISDGSSNDARAANFNELDASRGMLALSHQNVADLTPRNIYDVRARDSGYGFPQTSSAHSSISAESGRGYPYYGSSVSSVADSATDYSSAASDAGYDPMSSRTLPRPTQFMGAPLGPPALQSMMGQFSSKISGNTQKKHKCKICDKRFTRPSSLQTHMYSHTGEKPFACDVEGCGRHFSVVSNLRRHKKVHKGEGASVSSTSDAEDNVSG